MRVYLNTSEPRRYHTLTTTPGALSSEFCDSHGKPITFNIGFEYGQAEVPDHLGRWLIAQGLCKATSLILPNYKPFESPIH